MELSLLLYILPPVLGIILVLLTRKPILSLTIAAISGLFILYGFTLNLFSQSFNIIVKILSDPWNVKLILGLLILGGFIGVVEKVIQNKDIKLTKFFHSKKRVLMIGWISGLFLFIDDYFNILLNGVFLNSLTKKHKISKAKLAFIIHSLGVSACVLIPFSTWTIYIISIIKNLNLTQSSFSIYLNSIPYNFYAISLVLITMAVILYEINILKMKQEEQTSIVEKSVKSKETTTIKELLFPAVFLIASSLVFILVNLIYLFTKQGISSLSEVLSSLNFANILLASAVTGTLFVSFYYYKRNIRINSMKNSFLFGTKQMFSAILILFLAWLLGEITFRLGTANIIIDLSKDIITPSFMILISFILAAVMAFMTSSWATFAIVIPILLPLGIGYGINPSLVLAAVVSGGVFGDHNSPVSSTSILTKAVSKVDINDHFHTQLPYSAIAFVISGYLFFLMGVIK